ncbi:uncharacterized protein LOC108044406 isoform X2 [Drosophila rhopaloa]|uniref:Uncharacterized protein LOC108044406 isoform X2 n=1 Tax=Drosophila rhopaloa TaxID=1041015 RepID=A0A6P4EL33_DRORH|nr:uncharacterized protein LOC108044406 isoform X2 [Drosophila rhopaloa]
MSLLLETDQIHFEFSLGSGEILGSEAVKLLTLCKEIAYLKPPQIEEQDGGDDHNGENSLAEADDHGSDEEMKVTRSGITWWTKPNSATSPNPIYSTKKAMKKKKHVFSKRYGKVLKAQAAKSKEVNDEI